MGAKGLIVLTDNFFFGGGTNGMLYYHCEKIIQLILAYYTRLCLILHEGSHCCKRLFLSFGMVCGYKIASKVEGPCTA